MRLIGQDQYGVYVQAKNKKFYRIMDSDNFFLGIVINQGDDVEIIAEEMIKAKKLKTCDSFLTDQDMYYLRSILRQLGEVKSNIQFGPTIGTEVLADNHDWLDCFIDRIEKERDAVTS